MTIKFSKPNIFSDDLNLVKNYKKWLANSWNKHPKFEKNLKNLRVQNIL